MWWLWCIISIYLIGIPITYGMSLAYWQREFPLTAKESTIEDRNQAKWDAIFWPICILDILEQSTKWHGFKWR